MEKVLKVRCPTCDKETPWSTDNKARPFCSDRCKLIDLGAWASDEYAVPGNELESDVFSGNLSEYDQ